MRGILGKQRAKDFVRAACGAKLRDVKAPRELVRTITTRTGRACRHAPPRTARVVISRAPVHDANARHVRRLALMFTHILGWLGPAGRTGHEGQQARLRVDVLREKCGLKDEREVDRYLAVLRSAGILKTWQPSAYDKDGVRNTLPVGTSGHCFNFYELEWDIPAELERALASFHRRWWPRRAAVAPLAAVPKCMDADAALAAVRARAGPS